MDEAKTRKILDMVAEEIEATAFNRSSWSNVASRLSEAFPGSSCVVLGEDQVHSKLRHYDAVNIEAHHLEAYAQHFAFCNPWMKVWSVLPDGACAVSERDFPVKQIANTEFYNDFIRRIPNFDASTGMSLDVDPNNTLRIPLHYSSVYAQQYDGPAEWVMSRLKGVLKRTANGVSHLQQETDRQIARAALANRGDDLAIVVDVRMRIRDVNAAAALALENRAVIMERNGRLSFCEPALAKTVPVAVANIAASASSSVSSVVGETETGIWVVHFSIVAGSRANAFVSLTPLVLIQARNLAVCAAPRRLDEAARMFRLTPAEEAFCRHLITGASVRDIAIATGVTFETARSRLRAIFQKTDTHSQGELMALINRIGC
ncbi:helix-turn-helix transcriptional regulator [Agrobacterium vaccinii]|uniref:helix-turn-helix transcriptional regulator n=1 Tax=Agrobacterium vaccinii TaxID=2735528 RepID=UPI001E40B9E4|nr:helix-turn-helix transcriptional regulator [Agrobacterium vaccinii]UHS59962.1 helix-turn-helix transcriptional regulator [Agrobacterium vaccinii]